MKRNLLLAVLGLAAGTAIATFFLVNRAPLYKGSPIPPQGKLKFPKSSNPGNPENAIHDFQRLFTAIDGYRKLHGKLPTMSMLKDTTKDIFPGFRLGADDFENPDNEFAEFGSHSETLPPPYVFSFEQLPRWQEGSPAFAGTTKAEYELRIKNRNHQRTIWVRTSIYRRSNARIYPDGKTTYHHTGFHILLWSDGTIEKVPESRVILEPKGEKMWIRWFPGEWAAPKNGFTVAKQWEQLNAKAGSPYIEWD